MTTLKIYLVNPPKSGPQVIDHSEKMEESLRNANIRYVLGRYVNDVWENENGVSEKLNPIVIPSDITYYPATF